MKSIGELDLSLITVWDNSTDKNLVRYELAVTRCKAFEDYEIKNKTTGEPEVIKLPKCETILVTKITKTQAKKLFEKGYKRGAGYYENYSEND